MKQFFIYAVLLLTTACSKLDLNPLSEGSSETWYTNEDELNMACAYLFKSDFWDSELTRTTGEGDYSHGWTDEWTDDWTARGTLAEINSATLNSQSSIVVLTWSYAYRCIAAANRIITNLHRATGNITAERAAQFEALARFARASQYSKLIFLYGDVPFYTEVLDIEEAFRLKRTDKKLILERIYEDYDFAIANLGERNNNNSIQYPSKGAALGMKARIALYMGDWDIAREASKVCIDLKSYSLYPDFYTLFLCKTKNSSESIFATPRSVALKAVIPYGRAKEPLPRIAGGYGNGGPSWDLLCSFLCSDGLPIDESPLYDPRDPFKNRDPRLSETIVPFNTRWLGYLYTPHPDSLKVTNFNTGLRQSNIDSRAVDQYASYNGLVWKKKIDEDWINLLPDPDNTIIRYADILLMYAEASIEAGDIDESVLDAINMVRARAYKVDYKNKGLYPAVTGYDPATLRKAVRIERRMEFAFEGRRYADLIRWKLASKALNKPIYGLLDVASLRNKLVKNGLWFFASVTPVDDDGIPDFSEMYQNGYISILAQRKFNESRQYLWPIPAKEILTNKMLTQNPGY
jgi:hypothetical protein